MTDHIPDAGKKVDHIIKAAKAAGGTTYTNRHYPGETACAFGPEALKAFWDAAYKAGMERAADIADTEPAPASCTLVEKSLWDVAATTCADVIRAHAQNIDMTQPSCRKTEGN